MRATNKMADAGVAGAASGAARDELVAKLKSIYEEHATHPSYTHAAIRKRHVAAASWKHVRCWPIPPHH